MFLLFYTMLLEIMLAGKNNDKYNFPLQFNVRLYIVYCTE